MTELVFPSRVDAWLLGVMALSTLLCAVLIPVSWRRHAALGLLLGASTAGMAFGTWWIAALEYAIKDDALLARSPMGDETLLQVSQITDVRPSNDRRGAPASSLDRFAITWGRGGVVLVSPDDRDGFLDAIGERAPGLVRDGERLYTP